MRPLGRTGLEGGKILKTVIKEYSLVAKNGFVWFREEVSDNLLRTLKCREFVEHLSDREFLENDSALLSHYRM
jgi:hypothetical protein